MTGATGPGPLVSTLIDGFGHDHHRPTWLSGATPSKLISEDRRGLERQWFGHHRLAAPGPTVLVDVGARSGLFALYHAALLPDAKVIVLEQNPDLHHAVRQTFDKSVLDNLRLVEHPAQMAEAVTSAATVDQRVGMIKVDPAYLSRELLEALEDIGRDLSIGYLCGEFSETDFTALEILRLSRLLARRFFWRNATRNTIVHGKGLDERPEVSIVVPMYQVEDYLDRCLASLSAQTLVSREILVINDDSRDRSVQIAEGWAARDPSIRVIHQANQGCAAARSKGLAEARGLFVGFVDSDDWVEHDMFERLLETAVANGADLAQGGYREVFEQDEVIRDAHEFFVSRDPGSNCQLVADIPSLMTLKPTIWRRLYRTSFLRDNRLDFHRSLRRFDDLPFQFEVFMKADRVAAIPDVFYNYRMGRVGQDVGATDERLYVHFEIFEILRQAVADSVNPLYERALRRVQFNTHRWGHERIEGRFKADYLMRAARDLFGDRLMLSRWTTCLELWRQAGGARARTWLLRVCWIAIRHGDLQRPALYRAPTVKETQAAAG